MSGLKSVPIKINGKKMLCNETPIVTPIQKDEVNIRIKGLMGPRSILESLPLDHEFTLQIRLRFYKAFIVAHGPKIRANETTIMENVLIVARPV